MVLKMFFVQVLIGLYQRTNIYTSPKQISGSVSLTTNYKRLAFNASVFTSASSIWL